MSTNRPHFWLRASNERGARKRVPPGPDCAPRGDRGGSWCRDPVRLVTGRAGALIARRSILKRPPPGLFKPQDFQRFVSIKATSLRRKAPNSQESWGKRTKCKSRGVGAKRGSKSHLNGTPNRFVGWPNSETRNPLLALYSLRCLTVGPAGR